MTAPTPLTKPSPPVAQLALFDGAHASHRLSTKAITVDAITYRLLLAVPRDAPPSAGFPILYLLDGNAAFDLMDTVLLASAKDTILVGIAHDTPLRFDPPSRSRDYTPDIDGRGLQADPDRPGRLIGGANDFLERLVGPIRAAAEAGVPVDPGRRALFGHSLAGMFALYTLLRAPGVFARIAAASPSIWWGGEFMLRLEARTPALEPPCDVLVTLGDSERRSSPAGPHWDGPAPHTLEMIARLQARANTNVSSHIFPGLGHAATLPASLPVALAFSAGLSAG